MFLGLRGEPSSQVSPLRLPLPSLFSPRAKTDRSQPCTHWRWNTRWSIRRAHLRLQEHGWKAVTGARSRSARGTYSSRDRAARGAQLARRTANRSLERRGYWERRPQSLARWSGQPTAAWRPTCTRARDAHAPLKSGNRHPCLMLLLARASMPGALPWPPDTVGKRPWSVSSLRGWSLAGDLRPGGRSGHRSSSPTSRRIPLALRSRLRPSTLLVRFHGLRSAGSAGGRAVAPPLRPSRLPGSVGKRGGDWRRVPFGDGPLRLTAASMACASGCHPWHPAASFGGRPCPPAFGLKFFPLLAVATRDWLRYVLGHSPLARLASDRCMPILCVLPQERCYSPFPVPVPRDPAVTQVTTRARLPTPCSLRQ